MAAYRGYLRSLVAAKADDRADDFASALLEIHDEDPDALSHVAGGVRPRRRRLPGAGALRHHP
jgi:hypothetical protein